MLDNPTPEIAPDLDVDDQPGDIVDETIMPDDDDLDDEEDDETGIGLIDDLSNGDTDSENESGMITPVL